MWRFTEVENAASMVAPALLGRRMILITPNSTSMILRVPTLNDGRSDCTRLFSLYQQIPLLEKQEITIDFSDCQFLRHNAVAFLGGFARLTEFRGGRVNFAWDTLQDNIRANLTQNGFIGTFDGTQREGSGNSIPYREYQHEDMDAIAQLLRDVEPETFDRLLTVSNLTPVGQQAYDRVIENAKRYYALDEDGQEAVDAIVLEQASLL
jgi:hypothetical protein